MDTVGTQQATDGTTVRARTVPSRHAPAGTLDHVPTQRSGPSEPSGQAPAPRRRTATVLVGVGAVAALVVAGTVVQQQRATAAEQQHAVQVRTDQALAALAGDTGSRDDVATAGTAELTAARAAAGAATAAALAHANSTLAGAPHVGDDLRAPLQSGIASVAAILGGHGPSLAALHAGVVGLTGQDEAVAAAEQAWQAADAARVAAEQAAAEQAAAAAAAQAAAQQAAAKTVRRTTTRSAAPAGAAAAPAAGPASIPAGGLVCPGAPTGTPGAESSVGAIGAAINAYRASNGLPALSVSRSGYLVGHAADMADAGGIWHSGSDNIVGCISNGSASALVVAWSQSPPHNAQMLRTNVSSMAVGGANAGGWLYGAVKFN